MKEKVGALSDKVGIIGSGYAGVELLRLLNHDDVEIVSIGARSYQDNLSLKCIHHSMEYVI
ncbi:MAG: hypothetical protein ACLTMR_00095 [Faecalibacillus sp.]